jgi:hypothetical protein
MNDLLNAVHLGMRGIHVSVGFAGLALFWLIVALPKGSRPHRICGKIFAGVALIVGGTGLCSSVWALIHVESFFPWLDRLPQAEQAGLRSVLEFMFAILLFLSLATIAGVLYGVQLMRTRTQFEALRRTSVPFWVVASGIAAFGLMVFGAVRFLVGPNLSAHGGLSRMAYQVPFWVGLVGCLSVMNDWRDIYKSSRGPREWLYKHVEQMFGVGIAFHTAFFVFGFNRLSGLRLTGIWALVPWIVPLVGGMSLTHWYIHRLKRQMGDLPRRKASENVPVHLRTFAESPTEPAVGDLEKSHSV